MDVHSASWKLFASASGMASLLLFLELALATLHLGVVKAQSTEGFISIDCGIADGHSYVDDAQTTLRYVSDAGYIDSGTNHNISSQFDTDASIATQDRTLRSFPQGRRNCYTLTAQQDQKYLIRARFFHGGYDGKTLSAVDPLTFDLHLGVNLWDSMNISNSTAPYTTEVLTLATADYLSVCFVNKGSGTPFVSSLELRPFRIDMYNNVTDSVAFVKFIGVNFGETSEVIRFPQDPFDRTWLPVAIPSNWAILKTTAFVQNRAGGQFEVPSPVLQTAVAPVIATKLHFSWKPLVFGDVSPEFHIFLHFAEIQVLASDQSRNFTVFLNGEHYWGPMSLEYLLLSSIWTTVPYNYDHYNFTIDATTSSTLPPIINALEAYTVARLTERATDGRDVDAIKAIKQRYMVSRDWAGDPCAPEEYLWDGLKCTHHVSELRRITTLNLSYSGLTGEIDSSFGELKAIEYLDLSNNNLTGQVPSILAQLPSLVILDLTNNKLSGLIPDALLVKSQSGPLVLRIEGNPSLCANGDLCTGTPTSSRKTKTTPILVALCVSVAIIVLMVIGILWRLRKPLGSGSDISAKSHSESEAVIVRGKKHQYGSLQPESRQFTYKELKDITNKFVKALGTGGFGTVYLGYLEDRTQVAVKIRSQSSSQGSKEFLAEVQHLTRVHHRNLVSLIGYCKDGGYLAVVYEYMSQGTLKEHLRGNLHSVRTLCWSLRLQIAIDAAQGLEYLHNMCQPPLIHRDITTGNILLSEKLEAKIADFGLSKAFESDANSHISTRVMGTPGYLDPEYYSTNRLSEKSDVYSFGVVLLEMITGKPPVLQDSQHIVEWVRQGLAKGNIEDIIDAKLQRDYDVNSVWKCADVALKCTSEGARQRPTMAAIVMQLKECLELETPGDRSEVTSGENLHMEALLFSQGSGQAASMGIDGGPLTR